VAVCTERLASAIWLNSPFTTGFCCSTPRACFGEIVEAHVGQQGDVLVAGAPFADQLFCFADFRRRQEPSRQFPHLDIGVVKSLNHRLTTILAQDHFGAPLLDPVHFLQRDDDAEVEQLSEGIRARGNAVNRTGSEKLQAKRLFSCFEIGVVLLHPVTGIREISDIAVREALGRLVDFLQACRSGRLGFLGF